jgi:hypothetical protein
LLVLHRRRSGIKQVAKHHDDIVSDVVLLDVNAPIARCTRLYCCYWPIYRSALTTDLYRAHAAPPAGRSASPPP